MADADETEDDAEDGLVPYAPDFTPSTLGKTIGADNVLKWLLDEAVRLKRRAELQESIGAQGLSHISDRNNRRDMANHVVQGLQNYQLINVDDSENVTLTLVGDAVRVAPANERDAVFGRHVLSMCGGYRLLEAMEKYRLRGERPNMELLNAELGQHPTSKNISTLRAWLARAGVVTETGPYAVVAGGLEALVGPGVIQMLGLDRAQAEFILAARVLTAQTGSDTLEAPDVRLSAETRVPGLRIPSKGLGGFVKKLADIGLVETARMSGRGGTRMSVKLTVEAIRLADEQVRSLLEQSVAGFPLSELGTLTEIFKALADGTADARGRIGERLAVHVCLALGLRVVGWRKRLPVEVDLTAERNAGLAYQRWHVQVKNVEGDVSADRVDREIGAAAGTGATHILFVAPRGLVSSAAKLEIIAKSRTTPLHIYWLGADALANADPIVMIRHLEGQEAVLVREKRREAERRENG